MSSKYNFTSGVVYTVSSEVLFIPVEGLGGPAICPGDKFVMAVPEYSRRNMNKDLCFRRIDSRNTWPFVIYPRHAHLIVEANK